MINNNISKGIKQLSKKRKCKIRANKLDEELLIDFQCENVNYHKRFNLK